MANYSTVRRPILSSIYTASAIVVGGGGTIVGVVMIMSRGETGLQIAVGVGTIVVAILTAIALLGVAEVVDYIGRIAYHSERIEALLTQGTHADRPTQHHPAIRPAPPIDLVTPRLPNLASSATAACPLCMAELDVRTLHSGRNRCPSCRREFIAE